MRYTREQMRSTINEWQDSGLSKKAFCREREINYATFHYWYKRMETPPSRGFAEVHIGTERHCGGCELIFPSGARMIFEGEPSATWLRALVG